MNDLKLYEKIPEIEKSFPLKIRRQKARGFFAHWHEHIELLHLLSGSGTFRCGAKTFPASAGDTVIV